MKLYGNYILQRYIRIKKISVASPSEWSALVERFIMAMALHNESLSARQKSTSYSGLTPISTNWAHLKSLILNKVSSKGEIRIFVLGNIEKVRLQSLSCAAEILSTLGLFEQASEESNDTILARRKRKLVHEAMSALPKHHILALRDYFLGGGEVTNLETQKIRIQIFTKE